jgi:hypothetical protein
LNAWERPPGALDKLYAEGVKLREVLCSDADALIERELLSAAALQEVRRGGGAPSHRHPPAAERRADHLQILEQHAVAIASAAACATATHPPHGNDAVQGAQSDSDSPNRTCTCRPIARRGLAKRV